MSANQSPGSQGDLFQRPGRKRLILLGLIILLAFGLRLFRLGHQELRGDEAFDALFSAQEVRVILDQLRIEQPYPPLFHVGLHTWLDLAGRSEVTQRLPAFVSGVLLVPLVYQLARLTLGRMTAMIAALLVAINPFYIWHAQDGRMYSLLAMFSVASMWLTLRLLQERNAAWTGVAYWAATVLALLTHYFAWWLLLAENAAALLVIWKQDRRGKRLLRWMVWQCAVLLPLVPWLVFASDLLTSHTSSWIPPLSPLTMLGRSILTFSLGSTLEPTASLTFSLGMGLLCILGCLFPSQPDPPNLKFSGRALIVVFAGVPLLATVLLSLLRPAFDEKYLIAIAACFLILVAHGLHFFATRSRLVFVLASTVILVASGWSLYNYFFAPEYAKSPSWRALVESINSRAEEGDVIIQNYPDPGFDYYYGGDLPVRLLPASASSSQERTARVLRELAESQRRIWFIPGPTASWDTEGYVRAWLTRSADLIDDRMFDTLRLQLFLTPQGFTGQMQALDAELGGEARLIGYRLAPSARETLNPGSTLLLTLYWQALEAINTNYSVFVHLSDPGEQIWGQHDSQPAQGSYPTSAWLPGDIVVDRHPIAIDPAAPPGHYRLMIGMYDSSNGRRLTIAPGSAIVDQDRILLDALEIAPASDGAPGLGP